MSQPDADLPAVETGRQTLCKLGFTLILLGYLMVWLPHEAAGLSFIGLEIGEWIKFLPQVRSGQLAADRNLFYLPPITLGMMLALWTAGWPNRRWQTWAMRALAAMVAMLALPSVEVVLGEGSDQWLSRLIMVLLVVLVAVLVSLLRRMPRGLGQTISWTAMLILALLGLVLPTVAYLSVRPAVSELLSDGVGAGPGLWLNGIGHLLVAVAAFTYLLEQRGYHSNQATRADSESPA